VGRRIELGPETWHALDALARDESRSVHSLAEEAFTDLLRKHRRPRSLLQALRESARQHPANDREPPRVTRKRMR
jgi:predicted transcriptional regulator